MRSWFRSRRDDESGATLVVVAVTLLGLFGITMLAVDGGSLLTTRRSMVTDTDAAALAAARHLSNSPTDCLVASNSATKTTSAAYAEALTVLQANDPRLTEPFEFELDPDGTCRTGKVRVAGTIESPLFFAGLFGFEGFDVYSSSSALYGYFNQMKGLRPFGICDKSGHYVEWKAAVAAAEASPDMNDGPLDFIGGTLDPLEEHPGTYSNAQYPVHRVQFRDPLAGGACGTDPDAGNWGWMDFDGGGPGIGNSCSKGKGGGGASDLKCRIDIGYEGYVGTADCDETESGDNPCPPEPGANATVKTNLEGIACGNAPTADVIAGTAGCPVIWILVYDDVTVKGSGGGKTLKYHPFAFLQVILRGFADGVVSGNPKAEDYFDFEFIGYDPVGPIDGRLGQDTTGSGLLPKGTQLCGGNYGGTIDENCGLSG